MVSTRLAVESKEQIKTFEVPIEFAPATKPTGSRGIISFELKFLRVRDASAYL